MTAIEALKKELERVQSAQCEMITEHGFVQTGCRYKYQELCSIAGDLKRSIQFMEALSKTEDNKKEGGAFDPMTDEDVDLDPVEEEQARCILADKFLDEMGV